MPDRETIFSSLMLSSLLAGLNLGWVEPNFWFGLGFAAFTTLKLFLFFLTFTPKTTAGLEK